MPIKLFSYSNCTLPGLVRLHLDSKHAIFIWVIVSHSFKTSVIKIRLRLFIVFYISTQRSLCFFLLCLKVLNSCFRVMASQSRGLSSKPLSDSKVEPFCHPSKINQMSIKITWEQSSKNLLVVTLTSIKRGHDIFLLKFLCQQLQTTNPEIYL